MASFILGRMVKTLNKKGLRIRRWVTTCPQRWGVRVQSTHWRAQVIKEDPIVAE